MQKIIKCFTNHWSPEVHAYCGYGNSARFWRNIYDHNHLFGSRWFFWIFSLASPDWPIEWPALFHWDLPCFSLRIQRLIGLPSLNSWSLSFEPLFGLRDSKFLFNSQIELSSAKLEANGVRSGSKSAVGIPKLWKAETSLKWENIIKNKKNPDNKYCRI